MMAATIKRGTNNRPILYPIDSALVLNCCSLTVDDVNRMDFKTLFKSFKARLVLFSSAADPWNAYILSLIKKI